MSTFSCPLVQIDEIVPHANADLLEIAMIKGYQCVVLKGLYQAGDWVVYVPTDSLVPINVQEALGLVGKLSGGAKNRVRAIKLRGEYSEGLVMSMDKVIEVLGEGPVEITSHADEMDFAPLLGITKYEEEIPIHMRGIARPRPNWFPRYTDIENWKKFPETFESEEYVFVTEKLHGTCSSFGMHSDDLETLHVSSRNVVLEFDENNVYWQIAREYDIGNLLAAILENTKAQSVVLYGETFGGSIQDLKYGYTTPHFRWFDLLLDEQYCDYLNAVALINNYIPGVPLLYNGSFSNLDLVDITSGEETISGEGLHMIEGVVIRPYTERYDKGLGRCVLKYLGQKYELRKGGSERH